MRRATRDLEREAHWQRVLARRKHSGLSVRAFCQAEGVSEPSFYGWRRTFDRADHKKPASFLAGEGQPGCVTRKEPRR